MEVFKIMIEKFDGKVVGSEDFNIETLKNEFFDGYKPGEKVKKKKKAGGKRAKNAFMFYLSDVRNSIKEDLEKEKENPDEKVSVGDISSRAGEMWQKIKGTDEATPYLEQAKKAKEALAETQSETSK
jgi:hypothetical protein